MYLFVQYIPVKTTCNKLIPCERKVLDILRLLFIKHFYLGKWHIYCGRVETLPKVLDKVGGPGQNPHDLNTYPVLSELSRVPDQHF